jgi:hypothetical protein
MPRRDPDCQFVVTDGDDTGPRPPGMNASSKNRNSIVAEPAGELRKDPALLEIAAEPRHFEGLCGLV